MVRPASSEYTHVAQRRRKFSSPYPPAGPAGPDRTGATSGTLMDRLDVLNDRLRNGTPLQKEQARRQLRELRLQNEQLLRARALAGRRNPRIKLLNA